MSTGLFILLTAILGGCIGFAFRGYVDARVIRRLTEKIVENRHNAV